MKTLYLIRHAKSPKDIEAKDIDRPLTERGIHDITGIANDLLKKKVSADRIVTSPALRTYGTALIVARILKYNFNEIVLKKNLYDSSEKEYLNEIVLTDDKINSLVIVGHDPSISETLSTLVKQRIDMPTSSAACIQFNITSWQKIRSETAQL